MMLNISFYLIFYVGIRDVLFIGGDFMVMIIKQFERYIYLFFQDLIFDYLRIIRIGIKFFVYWFYCYVINDDVDDLLW